QRGQQPCAELDPEAGGVLAPVAVIQLVRVGGVVERQAEGVVAGPPLASKGTGEPRGPPVTSNQLRSASARRGPPAVDRDLRAVDPARLVGGEEEGEVGDLLRL